MTSSVRRGERIREAEHADAIREALGLLRSVILSGEPYTDAVARKYGASFAALDALVAAVAAAEQERAEIVSYWQERHQVRTDQLHAAVARADALETALNQIASDIHPARPLDEERPRWLHENSVWWHHYSPQEIARAALASALPDRDEAT